MNDWRTRTLCDLVDRVKTWTPTASVGETAFDYIDLTAVDQQSKLIASPRRVAFSEAPSRARQLVMTGDVLVSTVRPNLNAVAEVPVSLHGATASTGFCVLRARPNLLDRRYLFHWVRSRTFIADMVRKATGASYPAVSDRVILESQLPVPPLREQRRIADVLDRADALRAKRRRTLEQLDALTRALFVHTFGDPLTNERGWPLVQLSDLARVERGKFTPRPRNDPSYYGGVFPFIQTGDISTSRGRVTSWTQTLNEKGRAVSRRFPQGTVVIAIVGATIGMTAILDLEVYCPDSIVGIQADVTKSRAEYIEHVLRLWRPIFLARAPETARANINLETIRPLKIPAPPLELQQRFAQQVIAVERLKTIGRLSLNELNGLSAALQQRAFRGEL